MSGILICADSFLCNVVNMFYLVSFGFDFFSQPLRYVRNQFLHSLGNEVKLYISYRAICQFMANVSTAFSSFLLACCRGRKRHVNVEVLKSHLIGLLDDVTQIGRL